MKLTTYPFPMTFLMNLMLLPGTEGSPGHRNLFQRPLIIKKSPFVLGGAKLIRIQRYIVLAASKNKSESKLGRGAWIAILI